MNPEDAIKALVSELAAVATERVALSASVGRILAEEVTTDRDSPPYNASAMDGYAFCLKHLNTAADQPAELPVAGEVRMGEAPPVMPPGSAVRIFTGGAVPDDADVVVKREDTDETPNSITLRIPLDRLRAGLNIRCRGENAAAGLVVLRPGQRITSSAVSAMAAFGVSSVGVYRRVRVAVLTTGDELIASDQTPEPWQVRDSNGPAVSAALSEPAWLDPKPPGHAADTLAGLAGAMRRSLTEADALILTGGVSMGDHDHVPAAAAQLGARTVYHGLAMRPGKPNFAAVTPAGQPILGLPGNPVSVLVGLRLLALPALQVLGGLEPRVHPLHTVRLENPDTSTLHLHWYRPACLTAPGCARLLAGKGSGDLVHTATATGFVHCPPDTEADSGLLPYYPWSLA